MKHLKALLHWWWVLVIVVVLAGAGVAVWWSHQDKTQSDDLTQVYVVERGNLVATVTCTGEGGYAGLAAILVSGTTSTGTYAMQGILLAGPLPPMP